MDVYFCQAAEEKNKKTLLYKKLLYHLFVCLMAMRTSLGKKEHETLTLRKKAPGPEKKDKSLVVASLKIQQNLKENLFTIT